MNKVEIAETQFTETLLRLSESIARVRDRKELFTTVIDQIKSVIPVVDTALVVLDQTAQNWQDWTNVDNYQGHPAATQLHQMGYDRFFPVDRFITHTLTHTGIMSVVQLREQYPEQPFGEVMWDFGLREMMFTPLVTRGQTIGVLFFDADQEGTYTPQHLQLFQAFADQIAVAVANILANEEILEREREKSLLLKISESISAIRGKVDLLQTINNKLQPIFKFDSIGLFIVDESEDYHYDISVENPEIDGSDMNRVLFRELESFKIPHKGTAIEVIYTELKASELPGVFNFHQLFSQYPHPFSEVILEGGYQETMAALLRVRGEPFGILFLNSIQHGFYQENVFRLFQAMADQVALAVANIQANEEILLREREKSQLLEITRLIAQVKATNDLLRLIVKKIKPLFGFHDCGLFVVSGDGKTHTDLAAVLPDVSPSDWNETIASVSANIPHSGSPVEWIMGELDKAGKPILFDFRELAEKFPDYPQIASTELLEMGYRDCLAANLIIRGESIGFFCINALRKDFFQPGVFSLFQSVTHTVSIAIANILANEEILEREREKTQLLQISEAVSRIQNKKQMLRVIYENIRPLFPFDSAGLFITDSEKDIIYEVLDSEAFPDGLQITLTEQQLLGPWRLGDSNPNSWWMQNQVVIRSMLEEAQCATGLPGERQFEAGLAYGLKQMIGGPLYANGRKIGAICFNVRQDDFYSSRHLSMFKSISDQVAVALANILANEEILEREREKANLLAISNAIATIRDKDDLFRVITNTIRPILDYDEAAQIFAIDPADQTIGIFLRNTSRTISEDADYQQLTRQRFPIAGSPFEKILAWPTVYLLDPIEEVRQYPDYPGFPIMIRMGIRQSMIVPLRYAGRTIGTFHVFSTRDGFFGPQHFPFYETVANQIAVAVDNILANEDILQREREKALQLAITNALTTEDNWESKLLAVVNVIQPHIPFDYIISGLHSQQQTRYGYGFYRTGADEYQIVATDDFLRLAGLTAERLSTLLRQANHTRPLLLNGPELAQYNRQDELKRIICQTYRLQSHLLLPVPLTREGRFVLSFYSRHEATYRPQHLELGQKLISTLALTLDRLLAYEEVEALSKQLQQENTYLQEEVRTKYRFEEIVGTSQVLREVFEKVSRVGPMSSTVLILGETGTGKELVARAIHQASPRHAKSLIKINCAALPAQLIESELFGHEKGAFTGAIDRRVGKFELAHESTIFLDEIGELPLELQAKLLRAIQEKEIERLGSNKVIQTDVRVLAATNRNLEKEVAEGRFRSDLYFRLNVYPIKLPPLRERREDIPLLATHFIQKLSKKLGKTINGLSNGAINDMQAYHWPGNIRELEHVIERAAIESVGGIIKNLALINRPEAPPVMFSPGFQLKSYADGERELIMNTLRHCNGRIRGEGGAAQLLKIKATTLEARMKKLGIRREFLVSE